MGTQALAVLGAVHTGIVFVLLYRGIQKLPTHITGALSFIYPVVAMIVDAIAFGQRLQPIQIAGAALVLFASAGATLVTPHKVEHERRGRGGVCLEE